MPCELVLSNVCYPVRRRCVVNKLFCVCGVYLKGVAGGETMGDTNLLMRMRVVAHGVGMSDSDSDGISVEFFNFYDKPVGGSRREIYMEEFDSKKDCKIDVRIPHEKSMNWWFCINGHFYESSVADHPEQITSSDEWMIEDSNYGADKPYVVFARGDLIEMKFYWKNRSERVYRVNFMDLSNNPTNENACQKLWATYTESEPRFFDIHVPSDAAKPWWFNVQLSKRPYDCGPCRACPQIPAPAHAPEDSGESHHYESSSHPDNIKQEDTWLLMEYSNTTSPPCLVLQRQSDLVEMLFHRA